MATKWLKSSNVYNVDTHDKGIIHIPGGTEWDGMRSHHTTQNGPQFKTYELIIYRIFNLVFLNHGWEWVTKNYGKWSSG